MKTYIYKAVAGVCSLMLLMSSCESFLSEEPKDFLSPENLPNTEAECNMLLMGSLSYWRSNNFERHINFIAEATTDAVVSATTSRIVPVAMASGTTILGMLPLLFDAMFGGMAATIMGGLLVASALTLFVLPVAYCAIHRIKG